MNPADEQGRESEPHGGEFVSVNCNLNFKRIDEKVIKRIETETNSPVRFAAGILRFKEFGFILATRCTAQARSTLKASFAAKAGAEAIAASARASQSSTGSG